MHEIDIGDLATLTNIIDEIGGGDMTLAGIAQRVEQQRGGEPIDQQWLRRVTGLVANLKNLKWMYVEGTTGRGRSKPQES